MWINALAFIIHTLLGLLSLAFLLRFYMQATNAPFKNNLIQMGKLRKFMEKDGFIFSLMSSI
jgi:hypothetical protein